MSTKIKNDLENNNPVSTWNRATVADGKWLNNRTIAPLTERDNTLADYIESMSGDTYHQDGDGTLYYYPNNDLDSEKQYGMKTINVSATNISGTNIKGNTLDVENIKVENLEAINVTITNLSAYNVSAIYDLSAKTATFKEDIYVVSGNDGSKSLSGIINNLKNEITENKTELETTISSIKNELESEIGSVSSYYCIDTDNGSIKASGVNKTFKITGGSEISSRINDGNVEIDLSDSLLLSAKQGASASAWISNSATILSNASIYAYDWNTNKESLVVSANRGSEASSFISNNFTGVSAKKAVDATTSDKSNLSKWIPGTASEDRPIPFSHADRKTDWLASNEYYSEEVYDPYFTYNPSTDRMKVKTISATNYENLPATGVTAISAQGVTDKFVGSTVSLSGNNVAFSKVGDDIIGVSAMEQAPSLPIVNYGVDSNITTKSVLIGHPDLPADCILPFRKLNVNGSIISYTWGIVIGNYDYSCGITYLPSTPAQWGYEKELCQSDYVKLNYTTNGTDKSITTDILSAGQTIIYNLEYNLSNDLTGILIDYSIDVKDSDNILHTTSDYYVTYGYQNSIQVGIGSRNNKCLMYKNTSDSNKTINVEFNSSRYPLTTMSGNVSKVRV